MNNTVMEREREREREGRGKSGIIMSNKLEYVCTNTYVLYMSAEWFARSSTII